MRPLSNANMEDRKRKRILDDDELRYAVESL